MKQNRIEEIKSTIVAAKKFYDTRLAEIRSDDHYSDNGKADLIASAREEYKRKRDSLMDELKEVTANERARLERAAFNAPAGKEDSYRSAIEKASAISDPKQREKLFAMAVKTNDTIMLKAMAAVSHGTNEDEQRWHTVLAAAQHDKDIANLVNFEQEHGSLRTPQQKIFENIVMTAGAEPAEARMANRAGERQTG